MILVTGANGFVGCSVVLELLSRGESVLGVDRRSAMYPDEVAGLDFREELFDVADLDRLGALVREVRPRVIISLAENADGPPADFVAKSVRTVSALFDIAAEAQVKRVCLASSLAVYLGLEGPYHEDMALPIRSPLHICGMKKGEELVGQWYADNSELEIVSMRLANIYGPRYFSMMNPPSRYLFDAINREIPPRPPLDKGIYQQLADFCHVEDCARAIAAIATADNLQHRTYNVAGGRGVTDQAIATAAERAAGRNDVTADAGASTNYLDISRIRDELGYEPVHDIDSGMRVYRDWLQTHDF